MKNSKTSVRNTISKSRSVSKGFWTRERLSVIGSATDLELARKWGIEIQEVSRKRQSLGIPGWVPVRYVWTKEMKALLGKESDRSIAKKLGINRNTVTRKRIELGIAKYQDDPQGIRELRLYQQEFGIPRVPRNYVSKSGFGLGIWIAGIRGRYISKRLGEKLQKSLESVPGWCWNWPTKDWETGFQHLEEYVATNGHARVPEGYESPDGFRLAMWVADVRRGKKAGRSTLSLTPQRRKMLEKIPRWSWECRTDDWEEMFKTLKEYCKKHKTSQVPIRYVHDDGKNLGHWVSRQRCYLRDSSSYPDRKKQMESLPGWVWSVNDAQFEKWFGLLNDYMKDNGHACIPQHYKTPDGEKLGTWVGCQRSLYQRNKLPSERICRLSQLSGWVWAARDSQQGAWKDYVLAFSRFIDFHGHSHVPYNFRTEDDLPLGSWISEQKGDLKRNKMPSKIRSALRQALTAERYRVPQSFPRL